MSSLSPLASFSSKGGGGETTTGGGVNLSHNANRLHQMDDETLSLSSSHPIHTYHQHFETHRESSNSTSGKSIPPAPGNSSNIMSSHYKPLQKFSSYYSHSDQPFTQTTADVAIERPFATPEDFENMVGDLRRTFIGWLKKTEGELRREREAVRTERKLFEEEKQKQWQRFLTEKKMEYDKIQEERRRAEASIASSVKQIAIEREDARKRISEEREKVERERKLWKRQALMEREKFVEEYETFNEERRKIVDANIAVQTMIDLNVGGVVFETSRLTLVQQQGSLLEGLVSGRHTVPRDRSGRIFIDRDSELFRVLLQFLRNPSVPPIPKDSVESTGICAEAEYYGIKFFPFPLVFAIGGHNGVNHLQSVEVLDVSEQCWRPCASLTTPRTYFGSTHLQGRLFVYGGQNFDYKALCDVEAYDILRDVWMSGPNLNIPRRNTCGTTLGLRIFSIGGFDGIGILSSVEAYDPRMKNWMEVAPLITPRSSACCAVLGDSIYILGGTSGERLRSVERFDSRTNKWEELSSNPMIEIRSAACVGALHGSLHVIGGTDNSHKVLNSIESMDRHPEKWMFRQDLPEPRMDAACTTVSDSIMVTGGQDENVLSSSLFYRPELDEWRNGPVMLIPRYGHGLLTANI